MHTFLKRLFLIALSIVLLLTTACTTSDTPGFSGGDFNKKDFIPSGEKISSSIFGRNVKYDSWSIKDGMTLPVEASEIIDAVQAEKMMYILTEDGVYGLNLETGDSSKTIDADIDIISSYGSILYAYSIEGGRMYIHSDGKLISEQTLHVANEQLLVNGLLITDDYYVFVCFNKSGEVYFDQYNIFDKTTLAKVKSVDEKATGTSSDRQYSNYKGNSFLKAERNPFESTTAYKIIKVDLDDGKTSKLAQMEVGSEDFDFTYNPKTDTVLTFNGPYNQDIDRPLRINEFSLSDPDNVVHSRFYVELPEDAEYFVGVFENIVTAVCSADNEVRYFDFLNPPESITLVTNGESQFENIIFGFEKATGILVSTVNYGDDYDRLDMKLMAGDTDFDLFVPIYKHQHKYFTAGAYEDLAKYPELKERFDSDIAAGYCARLGDTYVGMPRIIAEHYPKESRNDDGDVPYSTYMSRLLYLAYNIDVTTGEYLDPDGEELYKLLKFYYDYPEGNMNKMPFSDDCLYISSGFMVMNPSSLKKDNAAKFLAYMFDACNGDIEGIVPEEEQYLDFETTENVYLYWHSFAWQYVEPIYTATNSISRCDGKASTIKEIAREAAMQTRMRMEG